MFFRLKKYFQVDRNSEQEWDKRKKLRWLHFSQGSFYLLVSIGTWYENFLVLVLHLAKCRAERKAPRPSLEQESMLEQFLIVWVFTFPLAYLWTGSFRRSQDMYLWPEEAADWFTSSNGRTHWKDGPVDQRATWRPHFPPKFSSPTYFTLSLCILDALKTTILFLDLCNPRPGSLLHSELKKNFFFNSLKSMQSFVLEKNFL